MILIDIYSLCLKINNLFDHLNACQCTNLIINIFNYLLLKMTKFVYFKSTYRDKSNNISFVNIYMLAKKYCQINHMNST
jgi:hypothetical protein